jgi:hypothetical protein
MNLPVNFLLCASQKGFPSKTTQKNPTMIIVAIVFLVSESDFCLIVVA